MMVGSFILLGYRNIWDRKIDPKDKIDSDAYEDNLSDEDRSKLNKIKIKVDLLQKDWQKIVFGLGEPDPYLAILVADGDLMGKGHQ